MFGATHTVVVRSRRSEVTAEIGATTGTSTWNPDAEGRDQRGAVSGAPGGPPVGTGFTDSVVIGRLAFGSAREIQSQGRFGVVFSHYFLCPLDTRISAGDEIVALDTIADEPTGIPGALLGTYQVREVQFTTRHYRCLVKRTDANGV